MNVDRLDDALRQEGLAAVIAGAPTSFAYFTGTRIATQVDIPDRTAFATHVVGRPRPLVLACSVEAAQVRALGHEVAEYVEFDEVPHLVLARQLLDSGLEGSVGYEAAWMPVATYRELEAAVAPAIRLVAADHVLDRVWAVKSAAEIAELERAAAATIEAVHDSFTAGLRTEAAIGGRLASGMIERGADEVAFMTLASGKRTMTGHPYPSSAPLEAGAVVRTDVGARFGGYLSDVARSGVVGSAGRELRDAYAKVAAIHSGILEAVRPGVTGGAVCARAAELYAAAGLPFRRPFVGHGIGIGVHEHPLLTASERMTIESGMVLCVENNFTGTDFRVHVENTGVVTEAGIRLFTDSCAWDRLLEV